MCFKLDLQLGYFEMWLQSFSRILQDKQYMPAMSFRNNFWFIFIDLSKDMPERPSVHKRKMFMSNWIQPDWDYMWTLWSWYSLQRFNIKMR